MIARSFMITRYLYIFLIMLSQNIAAISQKEPLRLGIAGITHSHVHWLLGRKDTVGIKIVGIAEPNRDLAERYARQYNLPPEIIFPSLDEMINATHPEAVAAFGSIFEHLQVVKTAALKGIHVMVEKPLAVSMDHARKMEALAKKHQIHLFTNYETTWYPTVHEANTLLQNGEVGEIRKIIVRDGHKGPKNIGVNPEFLEWLTDPVQNGGGAMIDFGCYGANIATWMLEGKRPKTVTAVLQQFQPQNNPKVDDDATILLTYDSSNVTIQASWNWPWGRKDLEVYGTTGAIYADNRTQLRVRTATAKNEFSEKIFTMAEQSPIYNDPFAQFAAIIRNEISLPRFDLSSLENNMLVVEILEAARESAEKGKTIRLPE
jgi:predicted dehydrogenase